MKEKNLGGRPLKFKTVKELEDKIDEYFKYCDKNNKPYSMTGLALALDTYRSLLLDYSEKDGFSYSIKKAKTKCENWVEEGALTNKINPTSAIFNLKNNYSDWKDKSEVDSNVNLNDTSDVLKRLNDR